MSLLFNMLSRLVITFLPRSKLAKSFFDFFFGGGGWTFCENVAK